jgi:MFS transporter, ACS family, solute carrier family 17 (sodium-dependent inorganic phosphate cotransporter), other
VSRKPKKKSINKAEFTLLFFVDFCLPQRIVLAIMTFLGFMCEYMMRNLLSIAITQIAKKNFVDEQLIQGEICQIDDNNTLSDTDEGWNEGTYEWSEALQGVILSSFYWGYIITHIPGGILVEKFGGKVTLLAGIVATSFFTCLTPLSITIGGSTLLIVNRVLMGLCQGFIYASAFGLLSTWIPLSERTTLGVFVLSGIQVSFKKS